MKKNLIRLLAYSFCIRIFYLSYQMVFVTTNYPNPIYIGKAHFYGALGLLFSLIYPISDIAITIKEYINNHKSK